MEERPLRLGYIGAGNLARAVHLTQYATRPGCRLLALAEARRDLGGRLRARFGVPGSTLTTAPWPPTAGSTSSPSRPPLPSGGSAEAAGWWARGSPRQPVAHPIRDRSRMIRRCLAPAAEGHQAL